MRRFALFFLFLPSFLFADNLWNQGQKWFTDSQAWKPAVMSSVFAMSDDKGKEEERTEESYSINYSVPEGDFILISSLKNGKDQTAKRRKELEEQKKKAKADDGINFGFEATDHPLNPAIQANVTYQSKGTNWIGVHECVEYGFTIKKDKKTLKGSLFLSRSNGAPIRMSYTLEPLPPMTTELLIVQNYADGPGGVNVLFRMEFSGAGSILFIKKKMSGSMTFGGYLLKS